MIDSALQILKHNNYKLTNQRKDLLEYLNRYQDEYINVSQVDQHMHKLYPKMSHNTIYRNIRDFNQLGIVELQTKRGALQVKYQCDFKHVHHHHFICTSCGKVQELAECPMDQFARQLPGCKISGHKFEIYGICVDCLKNFKNR